MLYLRLQLQLGGVQASASSGQNLALLRELVTKEVDKPGFSWLGGGPRATVSRQQAAFLQLCAEVEFRTMQRAQLSPDAPADGSGGEHPDAKVWMYSVYLKYWTLHLMPLIVYPKVLFRPNFSIKG